MVTSLNVAKKFIQLYDSAESRKIPFSLSLKDVRALLERKTCFYTNVPFNEGNSRRERSIDRVDNTKGYVPGNVVACIKWVNSMKGNLSLEELKMVVRGVEKHNKMKKNDNIQKPGVLPQGKL